MEYLPSLPFPAAYITCNDDVLPLGPGFLLTWSGLQEIVTKKFPLSWMMKGEERLIPLNLLEDALRIITARRDLDKIGRTLEVVTTYAFTRDQTIPLPDESDDVPQVLCKESNDEATDR